MKQQTYIDLMKKIKSNEKMANLLCLFNKLTTGAIYIGFIMLLLVLFVNKSDALIRIVLITGVPFVVVSIFRKVFDRERPYEKFGYPPVISKEKKGNSMPSRHVFSAFVIAMVFLYINWILGIIFIIISTLLAVIRVIGGVHFPSDVIVGALVGIISGLVGLWIF